MKFYFNPRFPDATNEQKWEQIRLWRNDELAKTDWTQLSDAPVNKELWANYRQELRDLPQIGGNADELDLPIRP